MFSNQLHEVTLMDLQNRKKIRIFDCRGVDFYRWNTTQYRHDLITAIDGHIKKDYEVYIF